MKKLLAYGLVGCVIYHFGRKDGIAYAKKEIEKVIKDFKEKYEFEEEKKDEQQDSENIINFELMPNPIPNPSELKEFNPESLRLIMDCNDAVEENEEDTKEPESSTEFVEFDKFADDLWNAIDAVGETIPDNDISKIFK